MNWLRENWFDAVLFILLTAVVVAIVLYLTGINPFARRSVPVVTTPEATVQTPAEPAATETPKPEAEQAKAPENDVTVLPLPPSIADQEEAPQPESSQAGRQGEVTHPATPPTNAAGAEKPQTSPRPSQGSGLYRVSVGAFTRPDYAVDLAKRLESQGYPVRIEVIGRVSRVVVGPYTSREEAERVKAALSEYEPQIYRGDTPLLKGIYLQVGAFKALDRARSLARELKAQGFPVAVYYRDGWAKVWVGPVDPARLEETKRTLEESGFQPVEVRGG